MAAAAATSRRVTSPRAPKAVKRQIWRVVSRSGKGRIDHVGARHEGAGGDRIDRGFGAGLGIDGPPAPPAPHDRPRLAAGQRDGQEGGAFLFPPVPIQRDLAEPEAVGVGEPAQAIEQRGGGVVRRWQAQLEAFGLGDHGQGAGKRILSGGRERGGGRWPQGGDISEASHGDGNFRFVARASRRRHLRRQHLTADEARGDPRGLRGRDDAQCVGGAFRQQRRRRQGANLAGSDDLGTDLGGDDQQRQGPRGLDLLGGGIAQDGCRGPQPHDLAAGHCRMGRQPAALRRGQRHRHGIGLYQALPGQERAVPGLDGGAIERAGRQQRRGRGGTLLDQLERHAGRCQGEHRAALRQVGEEVAWPGDSVRSDNHGIQPGRPLQPAGRGQMRKRHRCRAVPGGPAFRRRVHAIASAPISPA